MNTDQTEEQQENEQATAIDPAYITPIANRLASNSFYIPGDDSISTTFVPSEGEIIFESPEDSKMSATKTKGKKKSTLERDLGKFLETLVEEVDTKEDSPHEIIEGLASQQIRSWDSFLLMENETIELMTKPHRTMPVPLSNHSMVMIRHIKDMIDERIDADDPDAEDISTYTKDMLKEHVKKVKRLKRNSLKQSIQTPGTPAFPTPPSVTKSQGEKRYDAWTKTASKKNKLAFDVLSETFPVLGIFVHG